MSLYASYLCYCNSVEESNWIPKLPNTYINDPEKGVNREIEESVDETTLFMMVKASVHCEKKSQ